MKDLRDKIDVVLDDKIYEFRKFTINDNIWQQENEIDIRPIFAEPMDTTALTRMMYHQLADRSQFPERELTDYDENGVPTKVRRGGLFSFRDLISGPKELVALLEAFSKLLLLSRPELSETTEEEAPGKK